MGRWFGLLAVLGSLVACADDTDEDTTSQSQSELSDPGGGMGQDVPAPMPAGPWNDANWRPSVVPADGTELDSLGRGACAYGTQKIYDPGRAETIEVPLILCQ
jgi:hypothetical protein